MGEVEMSRLILGLAAMIAGLAGWRVTGPVR